MSVEPAGVLDGQGAGNPWSVEGKFLVGQTKLWEGWTSLVMIERYYFGGAHGNYRVVCQTVKENGVPVSRVDILERLTHDLGSLLHEQLAKRHRGHDFNKDELLPPDARRANAEHLEFRW